MQTLVIILKVDSARWLAANALKMPYAAAAAMQQFSKYWTCSNAPPPRTLFFSPTVDRLQSSKIIIIHFVELRKVGALKAAYDLFMECKIDSMNSKLKFGENVHQ